jgi:NAD(P)-dependent dehydrogenase (short-subunit alcohol dehydrogenase family)
MIDFAGRVVLVTGAGRGLGAAYARVIAGPGATVIVHDAGVARDGSGHDPTVADAVVDEIRSAGATAEAAYHDLSNSGACTALVEETLARHGRIDALVHNAGLVLRARLDETDEQLWRRSLAVNIEAALWLCRAVVPTMRERTYGRIVLTTSGYGIGPADDVDDLVAYCVAKAAQFGLMNGLAFAAYEGVLVNAVAPVAATRIYTRKTAPGELTPDQVAPGVAFLASSACEVSGVVLHAAGGRFSLGGTGVDFGNEPVTPDVIADRWAEIAR